MRRTLGVALVAVLVLLAGCSAGTGGDATATHTTTHDGADTTTTDDDATGGDATTAADGSPSGGDASADSRVDFYLSDRPSAIDDFDHLNVTVTKVGVHRAGNGSADGEWLEFDVNATADLTRLRGANASKIAAFDLPNGSYTKVFVYVSETEGVANGTSRTVKLPSEKLQLNRGFAVGDGSNVEFVFDVAVHSAGNSGKYVLSPVVSESGTGDEVEIRDVGADRDAANGTAAPTAETPEPTTETPAPSTETAASEGDATPA